jgi:hypothetical protein
MRRIDWGVVGYCLLAIVLSGNALLYLLFWAGSKMFE